MLVLCIILSSCFLFYQPVVCDSPETSGACLDMGINCTVLHWKIWSAAQMLLPGISLFMTWRATAHVEQGLGLKAVPVGTAFYVASETMVAGSAKMYLQALKQNKSKQDNRQEKEASLIINQTKQICWDQHCFPWCLSCQWITKNSRWAVPYRSAPKLLPQPQFAQCSQGGTVQSCVLTPPNTGPLAAGPATNLKHWALLKKCI